MIGALVFLGCPLRMVLRLAGGDLNALIGIAGLSPEFLPEFSFSTRGSISREAISLQRWKDICFLP
jgi:hypothetical protein